MMEGADQFCPIEPGSPLASPEFEAFYRLWDTARGDAPLPHMRALQPASIPPRFLPHITVIGVENDATRFVIRLAGSAIREIAQIEMTGWEIDEEHSDPIELNISQASLDRMKWAVANRKPYCLGAQARWSERDMLSQRTLVLPYAGDDGRVQRFLTLNDLAIAEDPCATCAARNCAPKLRVASVH